jgi:hypothetical protein
LLLLLLLLLPLLACGAMSYKGSMQLRLTLHSRQAPPIAAAAAAACASSGRCRKEVACVNLHRPRLPDVLVNLLWSSAAPNSFVGAAAAAAAAAVVSSSSSFPCVAGQALALVDDETVIQRSCNPQRCAYAGGTIVVPEIATQPCDFQARPPFNH